jgi:hypothetical protein
MKIEKISLTLFVKAGRYIHTAFASKKEIPQKGNYIVIFMQ